MFVDSSVPMHLLGPAHLHEADALHLAVTEQPPVGKLLRFDAGFEGFPGIVRLH